MPANDEKGTPLTWRYQNDLHAESVERQPGKWTSEDDRGKTDIDIAQSDSRTPRKPYACSNKRKFARRSVRTLRGGRESSPLSGGSKHMLSAGRTSV